MKRLILCIFIGFLLSLLFAEVSFAGDELYRFMHNDHDTLIIGEITNINDNVMAIRAEDYIVSSADLNINSKKEQLTPQDITINKANTVLLDDKNVGDYVIASLYKKGDLYDIAHGIYIVDSLDYKTLKVAAYSSTTSAILTDFVNSGGLYTEYYTHLDQRVTRKHNGEESVIYDIEQVEDNTKNSFENSDLEETLNKPSPEQSRAINEIQADHANNNENINKSVNYIWIFISLTIAIFVIVLFAVKNRNKNITSS